MKFFSKPARAAHHAHHVPPLPRGINFFETQPTTILCRIPPTPIFPRSARDLVEKAALRESAECVALLLKRGGIDPDFSMNAHGSTASHLAASKDHVRVLRILAGWAVDSSIAIDNGGIRGGGEIRGEDERDHYTLCAEDDVGEMRGTLTTPAPPRGANFNIVNEAGNSPVHVATSSGYLRSVAFFLELFLEQEHHSQRGVHVDERSDRSAAAITPVVDFSIRNREGMDCVALAAKHDRPGVILLLSDAIQRLTDGDVGESDRPCLVAAAKKRLRHWPDLNYRNPLERYYHQMPIHAAARLGRSDVIQALAASPFCRLSEFDSLGRTALHVAAEEGSSDVVEFFASLPRDEFLNYDLVDTMGRTPLYIGCMLGRPKIVQMLVLVSNWRILCRERKKASDGPLYVNVAHQPPLHAAVANDHVNTVSVLLDFGVNIEQGDIDGRTAISVAAKQGFYEMCQMLILHGANVNARSQRGGPTPLQKARRYRHSRVADLLQEFGGK